MQFTLKPDVGKSWTPKRQNADLQPPCESLDYRGSREILRLGYHDSSRAHTVEDFDHGDKCTWASSASSLSQGPNVASSFADGFSRVRWPPESRKRKRDCLRSFVPIFFNALNGVQEIPQYVLEDISIHLCYNTQRLRRGCQPQPRWSRYSTRLRVQQELSPRSLARRSWAQACGSIVLVVKRNRLLKETVCRYLRQLTQVTGGE